MSVNYGKAICALPDCEVEFTKVSHNQKYHSIECKREMEKVSRRSQFTNDVAKAVASIYELDTEEQVKFLRSEIQKLGRENLKLKALKSEQVNAVYDAVSEGLSTLSFEPVPKANRDSRRGSEEVAVAMVSDLQLAKKTPTYNTAVCEERMELYAQKIIELTNIQRADHPVRELRIWLLGDIIEGMAIFPGQQFLVDAGFYRQVTVDGPRILGNFIRTLLAHFEHIHIVGVIGNHGRIATRNDFDPESNGDRMLYKILELIFQDTDSVSFNIPDGPGERNWYAIDEIGNHRHLLMHGDQFNTFGSLYALGRKILGWKAGAIEEPWDHIAIGHFHQSTRITFGKVVLRVNGTLESYNTYAQEKLASMGDPSQHLMFVHPEKGTITAEYDVWLT